MADPLDDVDSADEPSALNPFDPQFFAEREAQIAKAAAGDAPTDEEIRKYLELRTMHYRNVFSEGPTRKESIDFVLADMAAWSRAYSPTWSRDKAVQDLLEGRREFYMRIMEICGISHDTQFVKYMNAVATQQRVR